MTTSSPSSADLTRQRAMRFVVLLGLVSLLADVTYEGARSMVGPFLQSLGASAAVVGLSVGFGEFVGYAVRLLSGYLSDRTGRYWALTLLGYGLNLLAVPALALAGHWPLAVALLVVERFGKALRAPARDAMLSHAAHRVGPGWGFGLHEAMDQIGAMLGPLLVAGVLAWRGGYRTGFAVLAGPALLALAVLVVARWLYPRPRDLEVARPRLEAQGLDARFWLYMAAVALVAAGFADFALVAYHLGRWQVFAPAWIPVLYALAMGVDALAALVFGRLYDRWGVRVLLVSTVLAAGFAPLAFTTRPVWVLGGLVLWGVGMGAQESVLRAVVARLAPPERRATAYGVFNTGYGLAWFAGSALMGWLYDHSLPALMAFSVLVQLAAVPVLARLATWNGTTDIWQPPRLRL